MDGLSEEREDSIYEKYCCIDFVSTTDLFVTDFWILFFVWEAEFFRYDCGTIRAEAGFFILQKERFGTFGNKNILL